MKRLLLSDDPLDKRYVTLKSSEEFGNAGEGAYAAEDVPADTVFVLYGGHILTTAEMDGLTKRQSKELEDAAPDDPRRQANWMYR